MTAGYQASDLRSFRIRSQYLSPLIINLVFRINGGWEGMGGGGISFSVCYYPRAGWSSILLFLVLLKEVRLRDHLFVSGVIKGTRKGGKTEIVSDVEIKVNQSTKPLNVGAINQNNKSIILLRQAHLL